MPTNFLILALALFSTTVFATAPVVDTQYRGSGLTYDKDQKMLPVRCSAQIISRGGKLQITYSLLNIRDEQIPSGIPDETLNLVQAPANDAEDAGRQSWRNETVISQDKFQTVAYFNKFGDLSMTQMKGPRTNFWCSFTALNAH